MANAYISFLSSDAYVQGILILHQNLQVVQSKYPLHVVCEDSLSSETYQLLTQHHIDYSIFHCDIDKTLFEKKNFPRWINTLLKIEIFNLLQFTRCVYLDCDLLLLTNLDHLFALPNEFYCSSVYNPVIELQTPSSSILVYTPNQQLYTNLKYTITHHPHAAGDEFYIFSWLLNRQNVTMLPLTYNYTPGLNYTCDAYQSMVPQDTKFYNVVHLVGENKPWAAHNLSEYFQERKYPQQFASIYQDLMELTQHYV